MHAIRQTFEQAPATIPIPEQWRDKRMEVILLVQDEKPAAVALPPLLANMPVLVNEERSRTRGSGHQDNLWDS